MNGLVFKLVEGKESGLGWKTIKILDRYLHKKITVSNKFDQDRGQITYFEYNLSAVCDKYFVEIDYDEFYEEVLQGIYVLE